MTFPVLEIPWMGGEPLLAVISLVFAIAACFSVGGSFFQVLLEGRAHREGNQPLLSFLQNWSRFFLLMTLIVGLVFWCGLWIAATVVAPHAVQAFVRIFFWVWMCVSILFLVQAGSALLYHSTWGVVSPDTHRAFGWIFFGCAVAAMLALNGAITFMLTPGRWLVTGRLRDAMFNPTFIPSAFMLAAAATGITGLICLVAARGQEEPRLRDRLVRDSSALVIPSFLVLPLGALWHALILPVPMRAVLLSKEGPASFLFIGSLALCAVLLGIGFAGPFRRSKPGGSASALIMLLLGLVIVTTVEWSRGVVRSPWSIGGYLYLNGIDVRSLGASLSRGFLPRAKYARIRNPGDSAAGEEIFRLQCMACHSTNGYNSIRHLVRGWDREVLDHQLSRLDSLIGRMPPFAGTPDERRALAAWLAGLARVEKKK